GAEVVRVVWATERIALFSNTATRLLPQMKSTLPATSTLKNQEYPLSCSVSCSLKKLAFLPIRRPASLLKYTVSAWLDAVVDRSMVLRIVSVSSVTRSEVSIRNTERPPFGLPEPTDWLPPEPRVSPSKLRDWITTPPRLSL